MAARLVLADRPQHAAPWAARKPLERDIDDHDDDGDQRQIGEVVERRRRARLSKGRGMNAMPKGPPVSFCTLSATSWTTTATPKVVIAR